MHSEMPNPSSAVGRRGMLRVAFGLAGLSLARFFHLKSLAAAPSKRRPASSAKSCIILYCWGGMSHVDTFDPKWAAPDNVRGEFKTISTATSGIYLSEHLPKLAALSDHLAIVRSIHHDSTSHGKGMYWNMTGHAPPAPSVAANLPPSRDDWPSLAAMLSAIREPPRGLPPAVRLPYPLVDNRTLQAGESAGWLGLAHDPLVMRTPRGTPFGGVSRDLGSPALNLSEGVDRPQLKSRRELLDTLEGRMDDNAGLKSFIHFQELALDMLLNRKVNEAFDLDREPQRILDAYGGHVCGQSALLARRLAEAGVPIVSVVCAAGDLNGSRGDHWDTHTDNFNRLKNTMLPTFDRAASALISDLHDRGRLDDTLVVVMGDFGRTPNINAAAGRDHYPYCFSVALAGGGIRGGRVYGSSDQIGAYPNDSPCGPSDIHATIFKAIGISPNTVLYDRLRRPHTICDGQPLPLF